MNIEKKLKTQHILLAVLTVVLLIPNIINLTGYTVETVEAFSVKLANMPVSGLLRTTAADVHPPLYYIILRSVVLLFGNAGIVYRVVSFLPYMFILLYAFFFLYKAFGVYCTAAFITFASLTTTALKYNTHIRMYSWCAMFLLLCFHEVYRILMYNQKRDYYYLAFFTLLGGYTQYYALVTAALMYMALLVVVLVKKIPSGRTGWLQSAGLVLIGYLPWLTVFLQSVKRTADSHWMPETEPFIQCYKSLFSARLSIIWPTAWLIVVFVLAVRDLRKPEREKEDEGRLSPFVIWLLIGVMAVFGTILTGYLVSALTRPVFNSRYLYPASIIAWVSLAAALERVKYKRVIVLTVLPVFLVLQTLSFFNRWQTGAYREQLTKKTVEKIWEETAEGAILLSKEPLGGYDDQVIMDMGFPTAPVTDYYFRGITEELRIDPETPEDWMLSPDKRYFLFLYEPLSEKDIRAIEEKGMHCDMLVEDGRIRNTKYTVYYLTGASPAP